MTLKRRGNMVDELTEKKDLVQSQPEERNSGEDRINQLEVLLAQREESLVKANARISELEQTVASRDSDIISLKQTRSELESRVVTLNQSMTEAVASYKAMVIQANPEVVDELVTGETIEAINESLKKAKALVGRVRQGLEAEISATRIPTGAPERSSPDLSALSPREKIQLAIRNR
jgi:chromosome segregation ATPase